MTIAALGIDLGRNSCSLVGLDASGRVVLRRWMRRETVLAFGAKLPGCIVAMEACCGAHHIGRALAELRHDRCRSLRSGVDVSLRMHQHMSTCSCVGCWSVSHLSEAQVADVAEVFRLLGEPNRLRIVLACLDEARGVGEIGERLGLSQSLTSHHLRLLRTARIMRAMRLGRQVTYTVDDDHVRDVLRNMVAHFVEPHEHAHGPDGDTDGR